MKIYLLVLARRWYIKSRILTLFVHNTEILSMDPSSCLICNFAGRGLHRFPRDKKRLEQWLVAIERTDLFENEHGSSIVYNSGRLCNAHFADWCFSGKDKKKLAKNALPSLSDAVMEKSITLENTQGGNVIQGDNSDVLKERSCVISESSVNLEDPSIKNENGDEVCECQPAGCNKRKLRNKDSILAAENVVKENIFRAINREKEPERIIGATNATGELLFLVKWKGINEADLLPSTFVRKEFPELLIQFYEERLVWPPSSQGENGSTEQVAQSK